MGSRHKFIILAMLTIHFNVIRCIEGQVFIYLSCVLFVYRCCEHNCVSIINCNMVYMCVYMYMCMCVLMILEIVGDQAT